jgi:hypothetical protein
LLVLGGGFDLLPILRVRFAPSSVLSRHKAEFPG